MKMYEVEAKCGHVGRGNYVIKSFPVYAESGKEAAAKVRFFPRVKHHHKDAILAVMEVSDERFRSIIDANNNDPYFRCHSIQDQRKVCTDMVLIAEARGNEPSYRKQETNKEIYDHKIKIRNPKKYTSKYLEKGIDVYDDENNWRIA